MTHQATQDQGEASRGRHEQAQQTQDGREACVRVATRPGKTQGAGTSGTRSTGLPSKGPQGSVMVSSENSLVGGVAKLSNEVGIKLLQATFLHFQEKPPQDHLEQWLAVPLHKINRTPIGYHRFKSRGKKHIARARPSSPTPVQFLHGTTPMHQKRPDMEAMTWRPTSGGGGRDPRRPWRTPRKRLRHCPPPARRARPSPRLLHCGSDGTPLPSPPAPRPRSRSGLGGAAAARPSPPPARASCHVAQSRGPRHCGAGPRAGPMAGARSPGGGSQSDGAADSPGGRRRGSRSR